MGDRSRVWSATRANPNRPPICSKAWSKSPAISFRRPALQKIGMPSARTVARARRENLPRVEQLLRVEYAFDVALDADELFGLLQGQVGLLAQSDSVFAAQGAAERKRQAHERLDGVVHRRALALIVP